MLHECEFVKVLPKYSSLKEIKSILGICDVLYAKNELFELMQNVLLNYRIDVPVVCGVHTAIYYPFSPTFRSRIHNVLYMNDVYGLLLRKSTAVHVLNAFDYNLMKSYYKVDEKNFLISLGVDTNIFRPLDVLSQDSKLKILFLGKIDEQKGFDILCMAINQLSALPEFNQISFTLVGTGKWSAVADNLAQTYPNIVHINFVPQQDIVNLYNSHDVFVLPHSRRSNFICVFGSSKLRASSNSDKHP